MTKVNEIIFRKIRLNTLQFKTGDVSSLDDRPVQKYINHERKANVVAFARREVGPPVKTRTLSFVFG